LKKIKVIFRWTKYNHYTLAAIFGFLDQSLEKNRFEIMTGEDGADISRKINSSDLKPCIVAYSFASTEFDAVSKEIAELKRVHGKDAVVICGGPHATALPESCIKAGADAVFIGEAEESFPAFLSSFSQAMRLPDERVIQPLPLKDFDSYPPFSIERKFFGPLELRRGCFNGCVFCQTPGIFKRVRERSINFVKKYVQCMKAEKRKRVIFTIPDVLSYGLKGSMVNLPHIENFLAQMAELDMQILLGSFPSEVFPARLAKHPEAAGLLKRYVTNKTIIVGGQSGSDRVLGLMKRNHSVKDIEDSARILREAGFAPIVDIMLGISGETRQDRKDTLKLMKNLSKHFNSRFNVHYFMPLPGTPFHNAKPETIEDDIKNEIYTMMKHGKASGDFFTQMDFAGGSHNG
jgi:B12-binding domain/radical SAM domain protein